MKKIFKIQIYGLKYNELFTFVIHIMNRKILLSDLANKDYKETWDFQSELLQDIVNVKINNRRNNLEEPTKNHFLFVEHP
ncbi:MAG: lipoyl(octanoyl) transferase, partial [Psychroserpens sp.]